MLMTSRDSAVLASLLPEELAVCYILLKLSFPATFIAGDGGDLVDYIGRRWFVSGRVQ